MAPFELDPMRRRPSSGGVRNAYPVQDPSPFGHRTPTLEETRTRLYEAVRKSEESDKAKKEEKNNMGEYIIWNPNSSSPPRAKQPDRGTAIRVAGRMAHENPGQEFYVCKLVNVAKKPVPVDVTYTDLDR